MKQHLLLDSHLKSLRLPTFLREYSKTARECAERNRTFEDFLLSLTELELAEREKNATARRIREAGFPAEKDLSTFEFSAVPKLNKKRILDLSKCAFLEKRENVVFVGPPGVGKTHLCTALAREACRRGKRVKFFTASGLATAYAEARDERSVQRLEYHLRNRHLIVIDELGFVPLGQGAAENLFHFISMCYERTSVMLTTNLPFSEWPSIFGDERIAGALLDRLTHRVHVVEIEGDSYRLRASLKNREGRTKGAQRPQAPLRATPSETPGGAPEPPPCKPEREDQSKKGEE